MNKVENAEVSDTTGDAMKDFSPAPKNNSGIKIAVKTITEKIAKPVSL